MNRSRTLIAALSIWFVAGLHAQVNLSRVDDSGSLTMKLAPAGTALVVLFFVATDCPVSDRYQPEISRLHRLYKNRNVRFWTIYPNPSETSAAIESHQRRFAQEGPLLLDPAQRIVRLAGARITPEAAVFIPRDGVLQRVYLGRIDDRYLSLGRQRPAAQHFDLANAIDATLAGRPAPEAGGKAVGCSIVPSR